VCESKEKLGNFSLAVKHTQKYLGFPLENLLSVRENIIIFGEDLKLGINLRRTIVIDFIIVDLFEVCPVVFPFK
jgi:hypothetical protein